MSFRCEHCGTANNEIQSAGEIKGTLFVSRFVGQIMTGHSGRNAIHSKDSDTP